MLIVKIEPHVGDRHKGGNHASLRFHGWLPGGARPSVGGAPANPVWVYNLRANPAVEIRDHTTVQSMRVREITDEAERARLWKLAVAAFPPYEEYQAKTTRRIPVFVAEPIR